VSSLRTEPRPAGCEEASGLDPAPQVRSLLSRPSLPRSAGKYLFLALLAIIGSWFLQSWIGGLGWIPTSSMESSICRGDLVVIYRGPYNQTAPLGRALRLRGFGDVQRHDILVVRSPHANSRWTNPPGLGSSPSAVKGTDQRVKRVIGLPGDTVDVQGNALFVNATPEFPLATLQDYWILTDPVESHRLNLFRLGIPDVKHQGTEVVAGPATAAQMELLQAQGTIRGAERCTSCAPLTGRWIVPRKGIPIVPRDRAEAERLAWLIRTYEDRPASVSPSGHLIISGVPVPGYAFQQSYLFAAGDNRPQSVDSRITGPIPFSLVRGKVVRVAVSWSDVRREIRGDRFWVALDGPMHCTLSTAPIGAAE